jgi:hypothetical protein
MAESIWSYEGDVAPQRNIHFPEVAPSRAGSRFTYSTPDAQRYAAGVLAPAQAAIRQAEEEDLKRRDDELVFQRNKALLEEGKAESKRQAELLAMEGPLTERLAQVQALISSDPLKAESALAEVVVKNSKAVSASEGSRIAIAQMSEAIKTYKQQQDDLDSSTFRQFQTSLNAGDRATAEKFMGQLKDSTRTKEAITLFNATNYEANVRKDIKTAEQDIADANKTAEDIESNRKYVQRLLLGVTPVDVPGEDMTLRKEFSGEAQGVLRVSGLQLGMSPEDVELEMEKDPIGFHQKLLKSTAIPVAGSGAKRNVGTVTGTMTP